MTDLAMKSTAIPALAWIAALALRRPPAGARRLVWTGAMAAVLSLPLLSISLPALPVENDWAPRLDVGI